MSNTLNVPSVPSSGGGGAEQPVPAPPQLQTGKAARARGAGADKRAAYLLFGVATLGALLTLVPFYLMLVLSLKTDAEVAQNPWALPHMPQWMNYVRTWTTEGTDVTFATFFKNTLLVAGLSALSPVLSSSLVAYALARLRLAGRNTLCRALSCSD